MKKTKIKYKKGQFVIATIGWDTKIYEFSRFSNEQGSRVMKIKSFMLPCDHFEVNVWNYKENVRPATEQDLLSYLSEWLRKGIYDMKFNELRRYMERI